MEGGRAEVLNCCRRGRSKGIGVLLGFLFFQEGVARKGGK